MGITIVQKSNLLETRADATKALILAGGAVTGGSFKAGGIKAFNDYLVNFSVNDFDVFVGISSGSMLATALMAGISPESILKILDGTSNYFTPLSVWNYYRPNFSELISRPLKFLSQAVGLFPRKFIRMVDKYPEWSKGMLGHIWSFVTNPAVDTYEEMMNPILSAAKIGGLPSILKLLPSGIFDNSSIETYFRRNIMRGGLTNDFREAKKITGKRLYISAMRLDKARRVLFGFDEESSLTISEAIQASTAMPGFYKPAHINGVDYVDGGVHETANIDTAVEKGAKLIVCYNPFRPYEEQEFVDGFSKKLEGGQRLAADGVIAVLNQIFRAFFHSRLQVAMEYFRKSPTFKGDIILIEPRADDRAFFVLNPLLLKNRVEASKLGFESVRNSIEAKYDEIQEILASYGIKMSRTGVENEYQKISQPETSREEVQSLLEGVHGRSRSKRGRRVLVNRKKKK